LPSKGSRAAVGLGLRKEVRLMITYEAFITMIAFGMLIIALVDYIDKKK